MATSASCLEPIGEKNPSESPGDGSLDWKSLPNSCKNGDFPEDDAANNKSAGLSREAQVSPPQVPPKIPVTSSLPEHISRDEVLMVSRSQLREIMREEITNMLAASGSKSISSNTAALSPRQPLSLQVALSDDKWGDLFDQSGRPTTRIEGLLSGIADHIILEYQPQDSIVITPEKLVRFYNQHSLPRELHPFAIMLDASVTQSVVYQRIADLYDDLGCQYHLIQKDSRSRPSIPALTPKGFTRWLLANILAYPDNEAKRLASIVLAMPINIRNPLNGQLERMPSTFPRRLLPRHSDRSSLKLLDEALEDFVEEIGRHSSYLSSSPAPRGSTSLRPPSKPIRIAVSPHEAETFSPGHRTSRPVSVSPGSWPRSSHSPPPRPGTAGEIRPYARRHSHWGAGPADSDSPAGPRGRPSSGDASASNSTATRPPQTQLIAANDKAHRQRGEKQYYSFKNQALDIPARSSGTGLDGGGVKVASASPRRSASHRTAEQSREQDSGLSREEADRAPASSRRRAVTWSLEEDGGKGETWEEHLRGKQNR